MPRANKPSSASWRADTELERALGPSMSAEKLAEAVDRSGYPLQTVVAAKLAARGLRVEEEWTFEDPESAKHRALDVLGEYSAGDFVSTDDVATTVLLALLIECKQSRHPYLAFEAVAPPAFDRYPPVVGLGRRIIELKPDDETQNWFREFPVSVILSMADEPLVQHPPTATTLSRAVAKGKEFELSGEEPYNAVIRPLVKAASAYREHWHQSIQGRVGSLNLVGRLVLPVAVIDAPLVLVRGTPGNSDLVAANWVRVVSRRPPTRTWRADRFDVVDIVHASFVDRFLDDYALPFARKYYEAVPSIHGALRTGRAVVEGWTGGDLPEAARNRLRPINLFGG